MIRKAQHLPCAQPFSSSPEALWQPDPEPPLPPPPPSSDPKAGLSARMSFVFDQIDAMERMRGAKDEALQRIRAWHQTKQQRQQQQQRLDGPDGDGSAGGIGSEAVSAAGVGRSEAAEEKGTVMEHEGRNVFKKEVELAHPWPEWIELMELLVKQNYFDHRRFNEDQVVKDLPIDLSGIAEDVGFDFTRDWATVRTACLNFGRDRFDILR